MADVATQIIIAVMLMIDKLNVVLIQIPFNKMKMGLF